MSTKNYKKTNYKKQQKQQNQTKPQKTGNILNFSDLEISNETLQGLTKANFIQLTDIQKQSIPPAILKKDVLGVFLF